MSTTLSENLTTPFMKIALLFIDIVRVIQLLLYPLIGNLFSGPVVGSLYLLTFAVSAYHIHLQKIWIFPLWD